ncbi:aminoglycoside phosphotransferase family protein [Allokutzneria oryzae]|uniref:Aminoglycoside phosphotransferase family protein n=1 Tax=Allokutzneria oryzae TaxID=1378989 RepID=A0ABV5ZSY0_9PSEU
MTWKVDDQVRQRFAVRFGPQVAAWLDALPDTVDALCAQWELTVLRAVAEGGTSRVFLCQRADGASVFLKLTPDRTVAETELLALRAWRKSPHVVDVLADDLDAGALLLPAIEPGTTVADSPELVPGELLESLRDDVELPVHGLPTLAERVVFLGELSARRLAAIGGDPSAQALLDKGVRLSVTLADGGRRGLVHGDLHSGNVLRGPRGLVAIDPRACLGDVTFDLVDWVLNGVSSMPEFERRITALTSVVSDVDTDRLRAWCSASAAMSVILVLREGGERTRFLLDLAA